MGNLGIISTTFTVQLKPTFLVLKLKGIRSLRPRDKMEVERKDSDGA